MKRRSRRMSWAVLGKSPWRFLVGWVQMLLTPSGAIRRNVPETASALSELLPPLLCLSLSMCTAFEQIYFLFVLLIKTAYFPHLKKCPLFYLQFWLSAMCLQMGTCVCRPQKNAGEEAEDLTMLQNAPQSGTKKFKAPVSFCLSWPTPGIFTDGGPRAASKTRSGLTRWHPVLQGLLQEFVYEIKALSIWRTQSITSLQLLIKGGKRSPIDWLGSVGLCLHWLKALNMSQPELCPDTASLRFNPLERFSFPDCSRRVRPEHALTMLLQSERLLAC